MRNLFFALAAFSIPSFLFAQVTMPHVFSDHMVLQRNIEIPVWGKAKAGSKLKVVLGDVAVTTNANSKGDWSVRISKFEAGGPYELKVYIDKNRLPALVFSDVLIGDVWLASGQSNMEWQVQQAGNAIEEIPKANNPKIRYFKVPHAKSVAPIVNTKSCNWQVCDSNSVKELSAVGYYFAKRLEADLDIPIGILQSTWGGTPIEAWISREMLLSDPLDKIKILANDSITDKHFVKDSLDLIKFWEIVYTPQNGMGSVVPDPDLDDKAWHEVKVPGNIWEWESGFYEGMVWLRKTVNLPEAFLKKDLEINLGHPEMNYSLYFNGKMICRTIWNANFSHAYTIPDSLLRKGKNTIALRLAALWGGGGLNSTAQEIYLSNGTERVNLSGMWKYKANLETEIPTIHNYHQYHTFLFNAMIHPIIPYGLKGFIWYQGENNEGDAYNYRNLLPMLITDWRIRWRQGYLPFLWVQLPNYKDTLPEPSDGHWAVLRESQNKALNLYKTGMACIIDLGEADNIHPSNKQGVGNRLAAVAEDLSYKMNIVSSGPQFNTFEIEDNQVVVSFTEIAEGLKTSDGERLKGFALAGKDQVFYWAEAKITDNKVVVRSNQVDSPVAVRYAWADNPICNLVNSKGLPALPFRTDNWQVVTQ